MKDAEASEATESLNVSSKMSAKKLDDEFAELDEEEGAQASNGNYFRTSSYNV